jgi:hypothetical protein
LFAADGDLFTSSSARLPWPSTALDGRPGTAAVLPPPPAAREAWLSFLLDTVPLLAAAGWDIKIEPDFPYPIAYPDRWFGELDGWVFPARPRRQR